MLTALLLCTPPSCIVRYVDVYGPVVAYFTELYREVCGRLLLCCCVLHQAVS